MIVLVFLLWMIAAILFFTNPQNETTRWGSVIAIFGGFGGLGVMLGDGPNRPEWILWADSISTSLSHYMTPYAMWIFGLSFAEVWKTKFQKIFLKFVFLIPVLIMYQYDTLYPVFKAHYVALSLWVVPYVLGMDILLLWSTWRENRPAIKKNKIFTCLVIVPMSTFALITNIVLEAMGIKDVWFYNPIGIAFQFAFFAYFIIKYGFLDVQIVFERQQRDTTMQAVRSGSALFNHTMKNEASKLDILIHELKDSIGDDSTASENIELALASTKHLLDVSTRIQSKLDIMRLKESNFSLSECMDSAIALAQPYIDKEVHIVKQYEVDIFIHGDFVHLQETFLNIIKNAIEAMNKKGHIFIKIYKTRRRIYIDIKDEGMGIKKRDQSLVLNPFYSTKGHKGNYGLGLTYCYNVVQQHNGDISIKSKENQGTTMSIWLPSKRIVEGADN
ncbi:sensor histidine kinase [Bacillus paranthracis]|uniref:sensor histidine kinase n=1 Tax=Bacillus paranthracis TaxID=2026186 RepID=UPI0021CF51FE|nr:HAMP domain-containing sensor histidine kinase [Bacillus paranthracis]MCU5209294.1 HAMP domain-containing histidine kinase [Bacillus paranthracis]